MTTAMERMELSAPAVIDLIMAAGAVKFYAG